MTKEFFSKPTTVTKGKESISYDVDWDFASIIAEAPRSNLRFNNQDFPFLSLELYNKDGKLTWKKADRAALEASGVSVSKKDFVLNKSGDFSDLTIANLVVIKAGTEQYKQLWNWLNNNPFDKNPSDGVFWHAWTGKWTAYNQMKVLLGLFDTPELAASRIDRWNMWWNNPC